MIKGVVRNYHWAPETVGALYFDSQDIHGLVFWHADIIQAEKELKEKMKKPPGKR